ncbi:MAG: LytTR family DNA-binding domain-containing protein [Bacteroidota bacterium]
MKVLIIEDELPAAERLTSLIRQYESHIEVMGPLDCVEEAVEWFKQNPAPDLAFMDIQLADGLSFFIFDQVEVTCPVIFTTAYDEYAIRAFKVNSVDYLLKPLSFEEFANSMDKYVELHMMPKKDEPAAIDINALRQVMSEMKKDYQSRFVVRKGEHLLAVPVERILYFYSEDKVTLFRTADNQRFIVDRTLGELEERVNPAYFFRINRKYLVRPEAIKDMVTFSSSRIRLDLLHSDDREVVVSRQRVQEFKQWLEG